MLTEYFDEDVASHPRSRIAGGRGDPHRCHDQAYLDSAGNREQAAPMRTRLGAQTAAGQRPEGECPQRNQRGRNREAPGTGERNPRKTTFPVMLATNACPQHQVAERVDQAFHDGQGKQQRREGPCGSSTAGTIVRHASVSGVLSFISLRWARRAAVSVLLWEVPAVGRGDLVDREGPHDPGV